MEHRTAELFEPVGRVFGCREMSLRATVTGHFERGHVPVQLPQLRITGFPPPRNDERVCILRKLFALLIFYGCILVFIRFQKASGETGNAPGQGKGGADFFQRGPGGVLADFDEIM